MPRKPNNPQAKKEHENGAGKGQARTGKVLPAQDFAQRDYSGVEDEMIRDLAKEMEAYKRGNGGKSAFVLRDR